MNEVSLVLWDKALVVRYPEDLQQLIDSTFARFDRERREDESLALTVQRQEDGRYTIDQTGSPHETVHIELDAENLSACLVEAAFSAWASVSDTTAVIDACAVRWDEAALLIAGAGKTVLANWFQDNRFDYLSDTMVSVGGSEPFVAGIPEPRVSDSAAALLRSDARLGLIIFVQLSPDSELEIRPLTAAAAALRLTPELRNGGLLPRNGFSVIASITRRIPALVLSYGDVSQLDGVADRMARLILDDKLEPEDTQRFAAAFAGPAPAIAPLPVGAASPKKFKIPAPTPKHTPVKLTIGMATYDDFDGVYFSIQALRLYHPETIDEVEYIVIDNHPDGPCSEALKSLEASIPNYRYVPEMVRTGAAQCKNMVFEEASGEFVVCMDCHVFIVPGALRRLLDYFDAHPRASDLLQGPLVMDDLSSLCTHFKQGWGSGMYGQWDLDHAGANLDAAPFEIPMQGMGLFACRREAWLGFHPDFRGFGGEEGYIHEKFRQNGRRTLCLPFLRWLHRFPRPTGVPYPVSWDDRIWNYLVGYRELGLSSDAMEAHFRELVGADNVARVLSSFDNGETLPPTLPADSPKASQKFAVPLATPRRKPVNLTIGMATYDDFDGVYFSIQALRLYHPEVADEVEYIVIDNNPDGRCAEALKALEAWIPNYRYVPELLRTGTSQSRNLIFEEAAGEFVLCMDCHVLLVPGALRRLLDYFNARPQTSDLLQGPIFWDDLNSVSTHFKPGWDEGMFGTWDLDQRGVDADAPPFEIPMQGLGLFACRREAWLGFHPDFRGFGGEEGYIHEKFRRHGHRTLCLPFLRWMHRFQRPMGVPYAIKWPDRIRNYLIGHRELGLASDELELHFRGLVGPGTVARVLNNLSREQMPAPAVDAPATALEIELDLIPRLADAIECEVLGDQIALYDSVLKKPTLLLNPSASLIFGLCDGKRSLCDIVAAIEERFPESGRDLTGDVTAMIRDGCEWGVIVLSAD